MDREQRLRLQEIGRSLDLGGVLVSYRPALGIKFAVWRTRRSEPFVYIHCPYARFADDTLNLPRIPSVPDAT